MLRSEFVTNGIRSQGTDCAQRAESSVAWMGQRQTSSKFRIVCVRMGIGFKAW